MLRELAPNGRRSLEAGFMEPLTEKYAFQSMQFERTKGGLWLPDDGAPWAKLSACLPIPDGEEADEEDDDDH